MMNKFLPTAALLVGLLGIFASPTALSAQSQSYSIPPTTRQLIVGLASGWNDSSATLQRWERQDRGWQAVGTPVTVRLGKSGLAWGLGLHPAGLPGPVKKESDGRAPSGVFSLGGAYGYAPNIQRKPGLPYHQVTAYDLWVEDPTSRDYNRHLKLPPWRDDLSDWEKKQQMKQDDPAHSLKLFIAHNAGERILPGAGSAIFFHIWRDNGARSSSGCTVMPEADLKTLIAWVDPAQKPLYVLLPEPAYRDLRTPWQLP